MSSGPVVSDTTPLINLVGIGLLDLLPRVYGGVSIPREVVNEFVVKAAPQDPDLTQQMWITVVEAVPLDPTLPKLGRGEAAAISLAKLLGARTILLDERKARSVAIAQGLNVVGTLAVLIRAKNQGHIGEIRPFISAMERQGRHLGDTLVAEVLRIAHEEP